MLGYSDYHDDSKDEAVSYHSFNQFPNRTSGISQEFLEEKIEIDNEIEYPDEMDINEPYQDAYFGNQGKKSPKVSKNKKKTSGKSLKNSKQNRDVGYQGNNTNNLRNRKPDASCGMATISKMPSSKIKQKNKTNKIKQKNLGDNFPESRYSSYQNKVDPSNARKDTFLNTIPFSQFNDDTQMVDEKKWAKSRSERTYSEDIGTQRKSQKKSDKRLKTETMPRSTYQPLMDDFKKYFRSMPKCSEQILLSLIDQLEANQSKDIDFHKLKSKSNNLKGRLQWEGHYRKIGDFFTEGMQHLERKEWKPCLAKFYRILEEVRPINMRYLTYLIKENKNAKKQLAGKNAIVLFGNTGVGKSTLIHMLSGSQFKEVSYKKIRHYKPYNNISSAAKKVSVSPEMKSETRYLHAVPVKAPNRSPYQNLVICDTPGFKDTAGPEVDIANSFSLLAFRSCKTVMPVLLISANSLGDRAEGLRDVVYLISKMMTQHDEVRHFSFIFTKFSPNMQRSFVGIIQDLIEKTNKKQSDNTVLLNLLGGMKDDAADEKHFVHPMKSSGSHLLQSLLNDIVKEALIIERPSESFQIAMTPASQHILHKQLSLHKEAIRLALDHGNYPMIQYRLDELKGLKDTLKEDSTDQTYEDCVQFVTKHIKESYFYEEKQFFTCIKNAHVLKDKMSACARYQKWFQKLKEIEALSQHIKEPIMDSEHAQSKIEQYVKEIKPNLSIGSAIDQQITRQIDQIKLIADYFHQFSDNYTSLQNELVAYAELLIQSTEHLSTSYDFKAFVFKMNEIEAFKQYLWAHLDRKFLSQFIQKQGAIRHLLRDTFEKNTKQAIHTLKKKKLDLNRLKETFKQLEQAKNNANFHYHIGLRKDLQETENGVNIHYDIGEEGKQFIYINLKKLTEVTVRRFKAIAEQIDEHLSKGNAFQELKGLFEKMDEICSISETIDSEVSSLYQKTIRRSCLFFKDVQANLKGMLKNWETKTIDYEQFIAYFKIVQETQWWESYSGQPTEDTLKVVQESLDRYMKELKNRIVKISISLDTPENIPRILKLVLFLQSTEPLDAYLTNLEQIRKESIHEFSTGVNNVFKQIATTCNPPSSIESKEGLDEKEPFYTAGQQSGPYIIDIDFIEKAHCFLQACGQYDPFKKKADQMIKQINRNLKEYAATIEKQLKAEFTYFSDIIAGNNNALQHGELLEHADRMFCQLNQILHFNGKIAFVKQFFSKDFKSIYQKKLIHLSQDVSTLLEKAFKFKHSKQLERILEITKVLRDVEECFGGNIYSGLYQKYSSCSFDLISKNNEILEKNIRQKAYGKIANPMKQCRAQCERENNMAPFEERQDELVEVIESDIKSVNRRIIVLSENMDISLTDVMTINDILDNLDKAQLQTFSYLEKDTKDKLKIKMQVLKGELSNKFAKFLDKMDEALRGNHFKIWEGKKDKLQNLLALSAQHCNENILHRKNTLEENRNQALKALVSQYGEDPDDKDAKEISLEHYIYHPPKKIYKELEGLKDIQYEDALQGVESAIIIRFRRAVRDLDKATLLVDKNEQEDLLNRFFEQLPDHLKHKLDKELKKHYNYKKNREHELKTSITQAIASENIDRIEKLMPEYKAFADAHVVSDFNQEVLEKFENHKNEIMQKFDQGDLNYHISIRNLLNYKPLMHQNSSIQRAYESFRKSFLNRVTANIKAVSQEMGALTSNNHYVAAAFKKNFYMLVSLYELQKDCVQENKGFDLFSSNFKQYVEKIYLKIDDFFARNHALYLKAFNEPYLDVSTLAKVMRVAKNRDFLFKKMVEQIGRSDQKLDDTFDGDKAYEPKRRALAKRIMTFHDQIDSVKLDDNARRFKKDHGQIYQVLNAQLKTLKNTLVLQDYLMEEKIDINHIYRKITEKLSKEVYALSNVCKKIIHKNIQTVQAEDYHRFNKNYWNLMALEDHIEEPSLAIEQHLKEIEETITTKTELLLKKARQSSDNADHFSKYIMQLKYLSQHIPDFKKLIDASIDEALSHYKHDNKSKEGVAMRHLIHVLKEDKHGIGGAILSEHKYFTGYNRAAFTKQMGKSDISTILSKLKIEGDNPIAEKKLLARYEEFKKIYDRLIVKNLLDQKKVPCNIKNIGNLIQQIASKARKTLKVNKRGFISNLFSLSSSTLIHFPNLLAHLFALWTVQNSEPYFSFQSSNANEEKERDSHLLRPHTAQIVAIFRMLGIGNKEEALHNHLVELLTGEGKSVLLAMVASSFALLGFDVSCACYSQLLSKRDYEGFSDLFKELNVDRHIHYNTFNRLCESIINRNGSVRDRVKAFIKEEKMDDTKEEIKEEIKEEERPKVLLIDEVDVFFQKDFYGQLYKPAARLEHPGISKLIQYVWSQKNNAPSFQKIASSQPYKNCINHFKRWGFLIEEAVKDMLFDLQVPQKRDVDYSIHHDQITYKEKDGIVYNAVYGYKTMFAYFHENEQGNISKKSLQRNMFICINFGSFSYAEIPSYFEYILGVTGTLQQLSPAEGTIIKEVYNIKNFTYCPSAFGAKQCDFAEDADIHIENNDDYFNKIYDRIKNGLRGKNHAISERAVIVFFETEPLLKEFLNAPMMQGSKNTINLMVEGMDDNEKELAIVRATMTGQITLAVSVFGRGTNFIVGDKNLKANGGVHVISTFLSEQRSEEVQIKGRTARQGDKGSFEMVLREDDLEKFQIFAVDIRYMHNKREYYRHLNEKRSVYFAQQYQDKRDYIDSLRPEHQETETFLANLSDPEKHSDIESVLRKQNKGARTNVKSCTYCLMDATFSMSHLLRSAKLKVREMFKGALATLEQHGVSRAFQMKFAIFRNYNAPPDAIFRSSTWTQNPKDLEHFMEDIEPNYGWGNEAIEVGFWHINQEMEDGIPISQVLLIGDAPPNTPDEVKSKREESSCDWSQTAYSQLDHYKTEMNKFNVPVHCFFVENRAKDSFESIASATGGKHAYLDVNSEKGASMLANVVTEEVLTDLAEDEKEADAFIATYRKEFCSYT